MEINELILKYLSDSTTDSENKYLLDRVTRDEDVKALFKDSIVVWNQTNNADSLKKRFNSDTAYKKFEEQVAQTTVPEDSNNNVRTLKPALWMSIAAGVVVLLGLFFMFNNNAKEEFVSYANNNIEINEIVLSDGTIVTLGAHAVLDAPEVFAQSTRNVKASGTLFFDVAKNKEKPFIISVGDIEITVLGTSFDVKQYENNDVAVTVETGKVEVFNPETTQKIYVSPGQKVVFNKAENKLTRIENDNINYNSWKTGLLVFQNDNLNKVIHDLESYYNVSISFDENKLNSCNLTAKFDNEALDVILESLELTFGIEVKTTPSGEIDIQGEGC